MSLSKKKVIDDVMKLVQDEPEQPGINYDYEVYWCTHPWGEIISIQHPKIRMGKSYSIQQARNVAKSENTILVARSNAGKVREWYI